MTVRLLTYSRCALYRDFRPLSDFALEGYQLVQCMTSANVNRVFSGVVGKGSVAAGNTSTNRVCLCLINTFWMVSRLFFTQRLGQGARGFGTIFGVEAQGLQGMGRGGIWV